MSIHIKPILTEKALGMASSGKYSFWVPTGFTKDQIKLEISRIYGVEVLDINTNKYKVTTKTNMRRQKITSPARKRAIVALKAGQKIDVFAEVEEK